MRLRDALAASNGVQPQAQTTEGERITGGENALAVTRHADPSQWSDVEAEPTPAVAEDRRTSLRKSLRTLRRPTTAPLAEEAITTPPTRTPTQTPPREVSTSPAVSSAQTPEQQPAGTGTDTPPALQLPSAEDVPAPPPAHRRLGERRPNSTTAVVAREGVKGCMRQRLLANMIDAVSSPHKIIICDRSGAEILSSFLRMHELMQHDAILVEDLFLERQPIVSSPALYFIAPEEASLERVLQDWVDRQPYKELHLFFTGRVPDAVMQLLARQVSSLSTNLRTVRDMMMDFVAPEKLFFSLDIANDLTRLFPVTQAVLASDLPAHIAQRLMSVVFTLGSPGLPQVRYQGSSRLAQQISAELMKCFAEAAKDLPLFAQRSKPEATPTLIIADRSFDPSALFIHDRTYQALLHDLTPLRANNMCEQTFVDRDGNDRKRLLPVDEQDAYWVRYRHRFIAACLEELPQQLKELYAANPLLAAQSGGDGAAKHAQAGKHQLRDVGSAVRVLPEFQEKQTRLSLHIDLCTTMMEHYNAMRLGEICPVEQSIATKTMPIKEAMEKTRALVADHTIPAPVRLRLLLLLLVTNTSPDLTEERQQELIEEGGFVGSQEACIRTVLQVFTARLGVIGQPTHPRTKSSEDLYRSQAYLVMESALTQSLNTSDYPEATAPTVTAAPQETAPVAVEAPTPAVPERKSLRVSLRRSAAATAGPPATTSPATEASAPARVPSPSPSLNTSLGRGWGDTQATQTLDLGAEGQVTLQSNRRVILFVVGGVTYGEVRAAYELTQQHRVEVLVGGTSVIRPEEFLAELRKM